MSTFKATGFSDSAVDTAHTATITRQLKRFREGDRAALDEAVGHLYHEMQRLAQAQRSRWGGNHTLGTTALCHEAYLKLAGAGRGDFAGRSHFLSVAARAMRQILVDYGKARKRLKRGGAAGPPVSLDEIEALLPGVDENGAGALGLLEEALRALEQESPRHVRIVECRFFGGMTIRETAGALDTSPSSVKRGWTFAQTWLHRFMTSERG